MSEFTPLRGDRVRGFSILSPKCIKSDPIVDEKVHGLKPVDGAIRVLLGSPYRRGSSSFRDVSSLLRFDVDLKYVFEVKNGSTQS